MLILKAIFKDNVDLHNKISAIIQLKNPEVLLNHDEKKSFHEYAQEWASKGWIIYVPPKQPGSSGKVIAIVLVAVIIIAIVGLAVYFLVIANDGDSDSGVSGTASDVVGTWTVTEYYMESSDYGKQDLTESMGSMTLTFNSDGSGTMIYEGMGGSTSPFSWSVENGQLCGMEMSGTTDCSDLSFNSAKTKMTISSTTSYDYGGTTMSYTTTMVLTKT